MRSSPPPRRPSRRRFGQLAVGGAAAALTGACSTASSGSAPGPLVFWGGAPPAQVSGHRSYLRGLFDVFTRETGIIVELRVLGWQDLFAALAASIVRGGGPDVAEIRAAWAVTLQSTGGLSTVDADIIALLGGRKRFLDASWHTAGAGGRAPTSVPVRSSVRVLLTQQATLTAAGIARPPDTWDELAYVAAPFTRRSPHLLSWAGNDLDSLTEDLITLTRQAGGEVLAGENANFATPGVRWALGLRLGLAAGTYAAAGEAAISDPVAPARAVARGQAALALAESSALGTLAAEGLHPETLWVSPCPVLADPPAILSGGTPPLRSMTSGTNLVVPRRSARAAQAWRLVAHLTDDVRQQALDPGTGVLPVTKAAWAFHPSPLATALRRILVTGSLPMPATVHQPELRTVVGGLVHQLLAEPGAPPTARAQLAALRAAARTFDALP